MAYLLEYMLHHTDPLCNQVYNCRFPCDYEHCTLLYQHKHMDPHIVQLHILDLLGSLGLVGIHTDYISHMGFLCDLVYMSRRPYELSPCILHSLHKDFQRGKDLRILFEHKSVYLYIQNHLCIRLKRNNPFIYRCKFCTASGNLRS